MPVMHNRRCMYPHISSAIYSLGKTVCPQLHFFFFSSRRRHTRLVSDWSSDVCSSDLARAAPQHAERVVDVAAQVVNPADHVDVPGSFLRQRRVAEAAEGCASRLRLTHSISNVRSEERRVGKECRCRWWS